MLLKGQLLYAIRSSGLEMLLNLLYRSVPCLLCDVDLDTRTNEVAYKAFPVGSYFRQGGGPVREHLCIVDEVAELDIKVGNSPLAVAVGPELKILVFC